MLKTYVLQLVHAFDYEGYVAFDDVSLAGVYASYGTFADLTAAEMEGRYEELPLPPPSPP